MFHLKLNRSVIPTHCLRFKGRGWGFQILESYLLWGPLKWMKHNRPLAQEPALTTLQIPGFHENNHGVAVKGWVRRGGIDRSSCGESKPNTEPPKRHIEDLSQLQNVPQDPILPTAHWFVSRPCSCSLPITRFRSFDVWPFFPPLSPVYQNPAKEEENVRKLRS